MFAFLDGKWLDLGYAAFGLFLGVFFIYLIKRFGGIKTGFLGPELNAFTFGFLCDDLVTAMQSKSYWSEYPYQEGKSLVLGSLLVLNLVLFAWNLKIDDKLDTHRWRGSHSTFREQFLSVFYGILAVGIYLVIKVAWN